MRDVETTNWGPPPQHGEAPRLVDVLYGSIIRQIEVIKSTAEPHTVFCLGIEFMKASPNDHAGNYHPQGDGTRYEITTPDGSVTVTEFPEESCVSACTAISAPGQPLDESGLTTEDHFDIWPRENGGRLSVENHAHDKTASGFHEGISEIGVVYDSSRNEANAHRMTRLLHILRAHEL